MKTTAVTVSPSMPSGTITLPSSKSILHRAIICAALANGNSHIYSFGHKSDDIEATIDAMRLLGAQIEEKDGEIIIFGIDGYLKNQPYTVFCNESGSTLRFLIPLLSLSGNETNFTGSARLLERPQTVYNQLFFDKNITFNTTGANIFLHGRLQGGDFVIKGDVSSQFITGMLFALPLLEEGSTIRIIPPFESKSYVRLTLEMLNSFGIRADLSTGIITDTLQEAVISVPGGQRYVSRDIKVEPDCSQLAFFAVLAAIRGELAVADISKNSFQGDKVILDIIDRFGADVEYSKGNVKISSATLYGSEIDIADCPDLGPALMVLAAFSKGETIIKNAKRLRIKESDRINAMEQELLKLGVDISSTENTVTISGRRPLGAPVTVDSHNDHRVAMSLAVFAACAEQKVTITGARCVNKSYPEFFEDLKLAGVFVEEEDK